MSTTATSTLLRSVDEGTKSKEVMQNYPLSALDDEFEYSLFDFNLTFVSESLMRSNPDIRGGTSLSRLHWSGSAHNSFSFSSSLLSPAVRRYDTALFESLIRLLMCTHGTTVQVM